MMAFLGAPPGPQAAAPPRPAGHLGEDLLLDAGGAGLDAVQDLGRQAVDARVDLVAHKHLRGRGSRGVGRREESARWQGRSVWGTGTLRQW